MVAVNRARIIAEWQRSVSALRAALLLVEAGLYADAISRMYYAILHTVTAALLTKGFNPATHRAARNLLNQHFIHTGEISTLAAIDAPPRLGGAKQCCRS